MAFLMGALGLSGAAFVCDTAGRSTYLFTDWNMNSPVIASGCNRCIQRGRSETTPPAPYAFLPASFILLLSFGWLLVIHHTLSPVV